MLKLDDRDIAILRVLSAQGRITNAKLAGKVGLSASPCWERVRKLEKAGVIEGYRASISLKKLAPVMTVFVTVELTDHTAAAFRVFEAHVQKQPEVTACWALGGGFDYLMQVVVRDIEVYQVLMDAILDADVGLARYFTYVVTKEVKAGAALPLDRLMA